MNDRDVRVNGWAQSSLMPPEHLRIALTVHVSSPGDSASVGVKVTDHGEGITLGIYSASAPIDEDYEAISALAIDLIRSSLREHHSPF